MGGGESAGGRRGRERIMLSKEPYIGLSQSQDPEVMTRANIESQMLN